MSLTPLLRRLPGVALVLVPFMALAYTIVFAWLGPLATNDGPIHLSFADFLAHSERQPALAALYEANPGFHPNSLIYYLLRLMLAWMAPGAAEAMLQIGYLLGSAAAVWFVCRELDRQRGGLMAVFGFPLLLNQMFFLGLYNYAYSTVGFLVFLGCLLRLRRSPAWLPAIAALLALALTFLAHAAGFVAALVAQAVLVAPRMAAMPRPHRRIGDLLRARRYELALLAGSAVMLGIALFNSRKAEIVFGPTIIARLRDIVTLTPLYLGHAPGNGAVAVLLGLVLAAGPALLAWSLWRRRGIVPDLQAAPGLTILMVWAAMLVLALLFPDTMGGGWTHFRRMLLFPVYLSLLCYVCVPLPRRMQLGLALGGSAAGLLLLAFMGLKQYEIKQESMELAEISHRVGAHCSVLPLVTELVPHAASGKARPMTYAPFYQFASYLQLDKDRPVLFNFLARLDVYPVRFHSSMDAQQLLYHWAPAQQDSEVTRVDIPRFEQATGIHVDYVLQWGEFNEAGADLRAQFGAALSGASLVYRSSRYPVRLWKRPHDADTNAASGCVA